MTASDYGSDISIDEDDLRHALAKLSPSDPGQQAFQHDDKIPPEYYPDDPVVYPSLPTTDIQDDEPPRGAKIPILSSTLSVQGEREPHEMAVGKEPAMLHPAATRNISDTAPPPAQENSADNPPDPSPIQRFRTKPQKTLSVTDMVSPAWCELQYWYVLSRHGRKRRTPAMRQGSAVHKTLEEQVHTTVAVEVQSREDAWGLRIWNVIQGLRTLQDHGMTRELEIWGVVEGEVVNGVIDQVSVVCPDDSLQQELLPNNQQPSSRDANQPSITAFLTHPPATSKHKTTTTVYLTDVKTRASPSLPKDSAFRPTQMQLMLYRRLLINMLSGHLADPSLLFNRYTLAADEPFSPDFLKSMVGIHGHGDVQDAAEVAITQHPTLRALWTHLTSLLADMHTNIHISPLLTAEYRSSTDHALLLGSRSFAHSDGELDGYLHETMDWWTGRRRDARGVNMDEAWKCARCEFAEDCDWRREKVEEGVKNMRARRAVSSST